MKKNLTRKLALSAVTMGVAALTVTSTTYAWYTTNSQATASGMKANTAAADSNLLIATQTRSDSKEATTLQEDLKWGNSVSFVEKTEQLQPAQWDADKSKWVGVDGLSDVTTVTYTVWFQATDLTSTKKLKLTLGGATFKNSSNEIENLGRNKQHFLVDAVGDDGDQNYKAGKDQSVGLVDVLGIQTNLVGEYTLSYATKASAGTALGDAVYTKKTSDTIVTSHTTNYRFLSEVSDSKKTGDAVIYYNNIVKDGNISRPETYSNFFNATSLAKETDGSLTYEDVEIATIAGTPNNKDAYFGISFTLFIDGWDYQCFNAVAGTKLDALTLNFVLE